MNIIKKIIKEREEAFRIINYKEERDKALREMVSASKRGDKQLANDLLTLAAYINLLLLNSRI